MHPHERIRGVPLASLRPLQMAGLGESRDVSTSRQKQKIKVKLQGFQNIIPIK
jgi:hypothetical protein